MKNPPGESYFSKNWKWFAVLPYPTTQENQQQNDQTKQQ